MSNSDLENIKGGHFSKRIISSAVMKMQFHVSIMLALLLSTGWASALCPQPYIDLGTGCYYFPEEVDLNWYESYFLCQNKYNGYLVEIESDTENTNLNVYIAAVVDPMGYFFCWLGASDMEQEGTYLWMTSGHPFNYTSWDVGQPNQNGDEDCLIIGPVIVDGWHDFDCNEYYAYRPVCETAYV